MACCWAVDGGPKARLLRSPIVSFFLLLAVLSSIQPGLLKSMLVGKGATLLQHGMFRCNPTVLAHLFPVHVSRCHASCGVSGMLSVG